MRAKKYGAPPKLRNSVTRRHLFYNQRKGLSLDELLEYQNCRCIGKWWEVSAVSLSENNFRIERKCVLRTEVYARAWDAVKDEDWEVRNGRVR